MSIAFTQYRRPDGRTRLVYIDRPENIEEKAQKIIDAGYRFEIEQLTTGQVSMTIVGYDPNIEEENDVAIRICNNDGTIPENVDNMIEQFAIPTQKEQAQ